MRWCLSVFDRDHRISQSSLLQTPRLAGFFYGLAAHMESNIMKIDEEKLLANIDAYKDAIARKGVPLDLDRLLETREELRRKEREVDGWRRQKNEIAQEMAQKAAIIDEFEKAHLRQKGADVGKALGAMEADLRKLEAEYMALAAYLPGLPAEDVPIGATEADNVELFRHGAMPEFGGFVPRDHVELARMHDMVDFEGARIAAGSRAYALKGTGALLELALLRFALDMVVDRGFVPVTPPVMVREEAMFGTGYFPLGEDNAYKLDKDPLYLTGTAEVALMAMQRDRVFDLEQLPLRMVGISTCFRREAGAAGRDTRGLYRVHQFQKVEQVVICAGDETEQISLREHYALLQNAQDIMQALEIPYRVVAVCTGDMGLGQVRKHDIEAWMPGRGGFGETHSCSTFHEFQARRLNIKYGVGLTKQMDGKGHKKYQEKYFVRTLNNTALAAPRILIPFLENHQAADGTVRIPPALRPYLRGKALLEPVFE